MVPTLQSPYLLSNVDTIYAQFTGIQARIINARQQWFNYFSLKSILSQIACEEWPDIEDLNYNAKIISIFKTALNNVLNIEAGLFGSRQHISFRQRIADELGVPFIGRDGQCPVCFILLIPIIALSCDETTRSLFNSNVGSVKVPNPFICLLNGNRRSYTSQLSLEPKFVGLSHRDRTTLGLNNTIFDEFYLSTYSGINRLVGLFTFISSMPNSYIQMVNYTAPINFTSGSTTTLTGLSGQSYNENGSVIPNNINSFDPNKCQYGITPLPICSYGVSIPSFDIAIASLSRCVIKNGQNVTMFTADFTPAIVLFQDRVSNSNFIVQIFTSTVALRMRSNSPQVPNPKKGESSPLSVMAITASKIKKNVYAQNFRTNHNSKDTRLNEILSSKISLRELFRYFISEGIHFK